MNVILDVAAATTTAIVDVTATVFDAIDFTATVVDAVVVVVVFAEAAADNLTFKVDIFSARLLPS